MPRTEVVFYSDESGTAPALTALDALLESGHRKAFAKCYVRIGRLAELGHELRRPEADHLASGIHELRATSGRVHYRILYFFHGSLAVLSHLVVKKDRVPDAEIERAIRHRGIFAKDPTMRTLRVGPEGQ